MAFGDEIAEKLKDAGNRLLDPPSSRDELFSYLKDLETILSKVEQAPSNSIKEALLPSLKALISDSILKNSDSDIKITVAVCFNEIMRITAPDSPYEDSRMKEIFELIVASFDKLSLLSGFSYEKALSIIGSVAKVRSCVMMLDIECYKLIIEMFEQFKRNLRPDHPPSVSSAMEDIMSLIIDESEDIPLELLKVVLDCVRKEKENTSPMSWALGARVMARTSQKLSPFLRNAIKSGDIKKDDYAPLIDSILQADSEIMAKDPLAEALNPGDSNKAVHAAAKPVLSIDTKMEDQDTPVNKKPSKASGHSKQKKASGNADKKVETQKENGKNFPNGGREASSKKSLTPRGRPKKSSTVAEKNETASKDVVPSKEKDMLANSEEKKGRPKKSSTVAEKNDNTSKDVVPTKEKETLANSEEKKGRPKKSSTVAEKNDTASKDVVPTKEKEMLADSEEKKGCPKKSSTAAEKNDNVSKDVVPAKEKDMPTNSEEMNRQEASVKSNNSSKKLGRPRKDATGGSASKGSSSKLGISSSEKEKNGMDEMEKKVLRRKRDQMEEGVFETPFGKKKYKEDIVGCRLKVWWPKDKAYYEGRVTAYNSATKKHRVDYDDGDMEILTLLTEKFEFIGDEIATPDSKTDAKPQPSSDDRAKPDHSAKTDTPKDSKDSTAT